MEGRRRVGAILLVVGIALVIVGLVGYLGTRGGPATGGRATPGPGASPSAGQTASAAPAPTAAPVATPTATVAPSPTADRAALVGAFLDQLAAAIRAGSVSSVGPALHPAVFARYGVDRCAAEMATRSADPSYAIVVLEVQAPAPWPYETDGLSTVIADAITVRARVTAQAATTERDLHVAIVDGAVRWFTDCGSPATPSPSSS